MSKKDAWLSWEGSGRSPAFTHMPALVPAKLRASESRSGPPGSIEATGADVHPTLPANQSDIPHLCRYN